MSNSRRNETARARRREKLRQQLSLTSVPRSEIVSEAGRPVSPGRKLDLNNHFGWTVLHRSEVGDGNFPHLMRFYEKPDVSGSEFQKVTYVLYVDKAEGIQKESVPKETQETQTVDHGRRRHQSHLSRQSRVESDEKSIEQPTEKSTEKTKEKPKEKPKKTSSRNRMDKKKKMISDFFYVKKDRSRSAQRSKSRGKFKAGEPDVVYDGKSSHSAKSERSEVEDILNFDEEKDMFKKEIERDRKEAEENVEKEIKKARKDARERAQKEMDKQKDSGKEKIKKEMEKKTRRVQDKWNLRAGADISKWSFENEKQKFDIRTPSVGNSSSKIISNFKYDREEEFTELLATPSGTNRYLYVNKDRTKAEKTI